MGEHAVKAQRHPERGDDVQPDQQAELQRADRPVPQQHDRHHEAQEGQRDADEICDFVGATH